MSEIEVILPGAVFRLVGEGSPGEEVERALASATIRRYGRGRQAVIACERETAELLADYLWSVAGVVGEMTAEERGGGNEHRVAVAGLKAVERALAKEAG